MGVLDGRAALVTGGSRGIGAAIARRLASEGADVAVTYVNSASKARAVAAEIGEAGRRSLAIEADNRDAAAVEGAVDQAAAAFGRLDILVNNAGVFLYGTVDEHTVGDFDATFAVNVRAAYAATRAAARHLRQGGRIVMIGSNLAERAPWPGIALYSASKAALVGLTKGLARDLGPRGITVNIVHPGSTDTDMNPASSTSAEQQLALMAIPRFAHPDDVAGLVAWLAGDAARSVTGAALTIDGGLSA